jgi:hypothetical protein
LKELHLIVLSIYIIYPWIHDMEGGQPPASHRCLPPTVTTTHGGHMTPEKEAESSSKVAGTLQ